jgi:hypothetical protein
MSWNWDAISAISEIIGAVAVVVSLIYVAVQIRQNTRAVRGATLDAITAHQQAELRWSSDLAAEFGKALEAPDTLSFEESWRLSEWLSSAFSARQNEYQQYRKGLLDQEVWESIQQIIGIIIGIDWVNDWWDEYGRKNLTREFVAEVEAMRARGRRPIVDELSRALPGDHERLRL